MTPADAPEYIPKDEERRAPRLNVHDKTRTFTRVLKVLRHERGASTDWRRSIFFVVDDHFFVLLQKTSTESLSILSYDARNICCIVVVVVVVVIAAAVVV